MSIFVPAVRYTTTSSSYISPISTTYLTDELTKLSTPVVRTVVLDKPIITATTTLYPTVYTTPSIYKVDQNDDDNDNYFIQKQMTEYLHYRILDKWLYEDELCHLLKYLVIDGGKVKLIKSKSDYKENKVCDDKKENIEKKADFIEENLLTKEKMKKLLTKVIYDSGIKWYNLSLPKYEQVIVRAVDKYLRKKMTKMLE